MTALPPPPSPPPPSRGAAGAGEKVWLEYDGVENVFGYVWTFLLQDILRFDGDMDAALSRIATANRTCSIWVSLSDRNNALGKVVQYSNQVVNIFNPVNFPAYASHDRFPNAMFVNKHVQPSSEPCMNELMHAAYGAIDANALVQIAAVEATGDMHAAIYEWSTPPRMYVTNAATPDASGNVVYGYQRQWLGFDMSVMWNTTLADW
jgi:isopenicillin-N N-acyltransferase like protein